MNILLISRFNVVNLGDLVITQQLYEDLSSYGNVDKFNIAGNPNTFRDIDNIYPSLDQKLSKNTTSKMKNKYPSILVKLKKQILDKKRIINFKKIIKNYDLVVLGGGNMLMSNTTNFHLKGIFDSLVTIAQNNNVPVYVMDIGFGPFYSEIHLKEACELLNKANSITFRDNQSYKLFAESFGDSSLANISIDPVFYKKYNYSLVKSEERKNKVGINIINSDLIGNGFPSRKIINNFYIKLIKSMLSNLDVEIILFITTLEDLIALNEIYNELKKTNRVSKVIVNGLKDLETIYNNIDVLVGTRMHSLIIGYTMYRPVIGLSWQSKVNSLFEIIDDQSSLFKLDFMDDNIKEITEQVRKKMDYKISYQKAINNKLIELRNDFKDINQEKLLKIKKDN